MGLAFEANGDLYSADYNDGRDYMGVIYRYAPDGTRTVFASGLNQPMWLAFEPDPTISAGQGRVQNEEAKAMQEMLRPFLDPDYKATEEFEKDKGNPSLQYIRETNRKIAEALPEKLSAPIAAKRRILMLTCKTMGPLHVPGAAGLITLLRQAEKKYGAFELTELYTTDSIDVKLLSGFDAVVLNNISQSWGNAEDKLYNQLLPAYVKNGGGLFAIHGSALPFMDKPQAEYNSMLGGFVMKAPALNYLVHPKKTGNWNHGSSFAVKILEPGSPLAAAFRETPSAYTLKLCWGRNEWPVIINSPKELVDELYVISPESNKDRTARCIVSVDPDKVPRESFPGANDFSYSLAWINSYGRGRVFYCQLGHHQAVYSVPCVARMMLDGLQYADGDLRVNESVGPAAQEAITPVASGMKLENPIFPYFFAKFDGAETKLSELGYAPYEFLMAQIDFTKDTPFPYPQGWIDWVKKKGWHGVIVVQFLKVRDEKEEATAITLIQQAADKLKGSGIAFSLYPYTGTRIDTAEKAMALADKINRENVGVTLQLIHEIKGGNSRRLPEVIAKIKGRLNFVVVCGADQPKAGENAMNWDWSRLIQPLGEGNFDAYGFVKELKKSGYQGPFGLICWGLKEPPLEHLNKSMRTWRKYAEKMGKE